MSKINIEELKTMIASQTKEMGLNDILDETAIEEIKNKIMNVYNHEQARKNIPEMIPEALIPTPINQAEQGIFPNSDTGRTSTDDTSNVEQSANSFDFTQQPGQNVDASTTGNILSYAPELPSFLDKIEPAKIIVFSQNELSEGGENLSNKPLRTFEDPDIKKSMNDFWLDKGQRKADVYMAKLEKIGELEFNYANGTTQFVEKRFDPDFEMQAKYKENPYLAANSGPATPSLLDINGQPNILNQIASAVDLEKIVKDIVMGILRDQFMNNNTKAVTEISPQEPMGYSTAQAVKPMEEAFSIKMIDLVNGFEKIDSPITLKEAIEKNDKTYLIKENSEVQEWLVDGKHYFTPVNKISIKKCYIKS